MCTSIVSYGTVRTVDKLGNGLHHARAGTTGAGAVGVLLEAVMSGNTRPSGRRLVWFGVWSL